MYYYHDAMSDFINATRSGSGCHFLLVSETLFFFFNHVNTFLLLHVTYLALRCVYMTSYQRSQASSMWYRVSQYFGRGLQDRVPFPFACLSVASYETSSCFFLSIKATHFACFARFHCLAPNQQGFFTICLGLDRTTWLWFTRSLCGDAQLPRQPAPKHTVN